MSQASLEMIRQRYDGYLRIEKGLSSNTAAAYCRDVDHLVRYLDASGKSTPPCCCRRHTWAGTCPRFSPSTRLTA